MDTKNSFTQHLIVGIFSLGLVTISKFLLEAPWSTSFARVSFVLLFLILIIGPIMRIQKPKTILSPLASPWSWRGELGIWFFITALVHFIIILTGSSFSSLIKIGGGGFGLANLLGLVALFWALLLTATSFEKVISYLGILSWKSLHSFTYVVFYLVSGHFIYFQFFSTYGKTGPDWFGYTSITMIIILIILQFTAFIMTVLKKRNELNLGNNKD